MKYPEYVCRLRIPTLSGVMHVYVCVCSIRDLCATGSDPEPLRVPPLPPPSAPLCPSQHTVGSVPHLTSPSLAPPSTLSFRIHSLALASRAVFAVCVRTLIVGAIVAIGYHIINSCEIDPFYPFYLRQLDIAELSNIRPPKRVWEHTIQGAPQASVSAPPKRARQPECICLLSDDEDGYSLERAIECD